MRGGVGYCFYWEKLFVLHCVHKKNVSHFSDGSTRNVNMLARNVASNQFMELKLANYLCVNQQQK